MIEPVTGLLIVFSALFGLAVGSFLNVVIYRVPLEQSISHPPSACPGCGQRILARDNVPVLSWVALRGRCRSCASPISARYPLVEALTAGLFVLMALRFGWSWTLPAEVLLVPGLVALAFIDLDHMLLPKRIVYVVAAMVAGALLAASIAQGSWHRLGIAVLCAVAEFLLLFSINLVSPRSLGFGDVRYGPLIALGLGWIGWRYAFLGFLAANLTGALIGVALIAMRKGGRKTPIPFGVFLSVGAVLAVALGGTVHFPN